MLAFPKIKHLCMVRAHTLYLTVGMRHTEELQNLPAPGRHSCDGD